VSPTVVATPPKSVVAFVALGGNLGDVLATFCLAIGELEKRAGNIEAVSPAFRTLAVVPESRNEEQPDFWNAVTRLRTSLSPRSLLDVMLEIETALGRERGRMWAPRTLDLDLILYGDAIIREPGLIVPHLRLAERSFVLRPLCEIDPDARVPSLGATTGELLARLPDKDDCILYRLSNWWSP